MGHPANIPLTPQTDERNFPKHQPNAPPGMSGSQYPKMLTRECLPDDREAWIEKNRLTDVNTGKEFWVNKPPHVRKEFMVRGEKRVIPGEQIPILATQDLVELGFCKTADEPIVVNNAEDEASVRELLGLDQVAVHQPARIAEVPIVNDVLSKLKAENALMEAEIRRRETLKSQLNGEEEEVAPKKQKRRKRRKQRVQRQSLAELANEAPEAA